MKKKTPASQEQKLPQKKKNKKKKRKKKKVRLEAWEGICDGESGRRDFGT